MAKGGKTIKGLHVEVTGDISGLKKSMYEAEAVMKKTQTALKTINKGLKLDPTNTDLLAKKQILLSQSIDETRKSIIEEERLLQELRDKGANPLSTEYVKLETRIAELNKQLQQQQKQLTILSPSMQATTQRLEQFGKKCEEVANKTQNFSRVMALAGVGMVKSAMDYESGIAQIQKVVKDLSDNTISDLKQIAIDTGTSFDEIAEIATIAGTLGIAERDIASFTETMRHLNVATDGAIAGEEGSKAVARFLNVMGIGTDEASRFGSAITYVGDQFAATGNEVLETATMMSGVSVLGNVSAADLIGLAAEMKNLGLMTSSSGSAITRTMLAIDNYLQTSTEKTEILAKTAGMSADEFKQAWETGPIEALLRFTDGLKDVQFNEINDAVRTGGEELQNYANALGLTAEQFTALWSNDSKKALEMYIDSLGDLGDESESASVILKELSLSGVRNAQTLLRLAGNGNVVRDAIKDANKAWSDNTALVDKANTMYETTEYKLKGAWESIKQAGAELGDVLLPAIKDIADSVKNFAQWVNQLDPSVKNLAAKFVLLGAGLSPVSRLLGTTSKGISGAISLYGKLGGVLSNFETNTQKQERILGYLNDQYKTFHTALRSGNYGTYQKQVQNLRNEFAKFGGTFDDMNRPIVNTNTSLNKFLGTLGTVGITVGAAVGGALIFYKWLENVEKKSNATYYAIQGLNDNLKSLGTNANETYLNATNGLEKSTELTMEFLESYVKALENTEVGSQEYQNTVDDIKTKVDELNNTLGGSFVYWDEEEQRLKNVKNQTDFTRESYAALIGEVKKNAWLEAHQEEYKQAMKLEEEANNARKAIIEGWDKTYADLTSQEQKIFDSLFEALQANKDGLINDFEFGQILGNVDSQAVIDLFNAFEIGNVKVSEYQSIMNNAKETQDLYNQVIATGVEDIDNFFRALNGDYVPISTEDLGVDALLEKFNELTLRREEITGSPWALEVNSDEVEGIDTDLANIKLALENLGYDTSLLHTDTLSNLSEVDTASAGILETTQAGLQGLSESENTLFEQLLANIQSEQSEADILNAKLSEPIYKEVYVNYTYSDTGGSMGTYNLGGSNYSPYRVNSIAPNLQSLQSFMNRDMVLPQANNLSTMALRTPSVATTPMYDFSGVSKAINSAIGSTYNSTNSVNIEFNVSTTTSLTDYDIKRHANTIANVVNEKLGGMLR